MSIPITQELLLDVLVDSHADSHYPNPNPNAHNNASVLPEQIPPYATYHTDKTAASLETNSQEPTPL